ncbi:MAG: FecR domain-containing protein [Bacteroidales bacterium]|nr:FecR domain-containing protein [Bacteroidales bacterium]
MSQQIIEKILSNSASGIEQEQFTIWLGESEENQRYFDQAKTIWTRLDGVYNKTVFDIELAKLKVQSKVLRKQEKILRAKWRYRLAVAASIVVLLVSGFFIYNQTKRNKYLEYSSGEATTKIELIDGSQVWLNKNSTLKLPENFSRKDRTVTLNGEAYFEVKRDETKPFKVIAGKTVTKVMGTSFNIELDTLTGNVKLNVNSGKVTFYRKHRLGKQNYLTKGAFAQYLGNENRIMIGNNESLNYLSWKTGKLTFYDTPIQQVCADLSKFYGVKVSTKLDNESILTGTFENEPLENVLSVIKLSLGVEIEEDDGVFVISR